MSTPQPIIRPWIAPGGLGWLLALVVLILCIVAYFFAPRLNPFELVLIGMLALARLL